MEKYKLNIELLESFNNINEVFKKIDLLILTSTYGEGCPNILIEALQSKILCFSTNVGDSKYILNNQELIIPENNPKKSKDLISSIIKKPKYVNQLVENNHLRSKKIFSPEIMVKSYEES